MLTLDVVCLAKLCRYSTTKESDICRSFKKRYAISATQYIIKNAVYCITALLELIRNIQKQ